MTTIEIRKLDGPSDSELLARWEDGEFTESAENARFVEDEQVQQMDEEQILEYFDGPYVFAVPSDDTKQKTLAKFDEDK